MENLFTPKRRWVHGPYLHFVARLDDPAYVEYTEAHH